MKTLIILLTFFYADSCLEVDVMILADMSASVRGKEHFIADAIDTFVEKQELSENGVRIGLIHFGSTPTLVTEFSDSKYYLRSVAKDIRFTEADGGTDMTAAMYMAINELAKSRKKRMMIIISDGMTQNRPETLELARHAKMLGIGICSVLITSENYDAEFMENISSNCYVKTSYETLAEEFKKLDICL